MLAWNLAVLLHAAIDAVDSEDEDFIAFDKISPNNLVEKIQVRNKKEKKCENECLLKAKKSSGIYVLFLECLDGQNVLPDLRSDSVFSSTLNVPAITDSDG